MTTFERKRISEMTEAQLRQRREYRQSKAELVRHILCLSATLDECKPLLHFANMVRRKAEQERREATA